MLIGIEIRLKINIEKCELDLQIPFYKGFEDKVIDYVNRTNFINGRLYLALI